METFEAVIQDSLLLYRTKFLSFAYFYFGFSQNELQTKRIFGISFCLIGTVSIRLW